MAIYHNHFQIIKRSEGRSTVAAAAYRAGENLVDHTTGRRHNFLQKGRDHVLWTEILLPRYAPAEWNDRETLWNAVECAETGRNAQLAREFNVAIPYECKEEDWVLLAEDYGEWFRDRGMCVDLAIHAPDNEIPNPHIHGMITMREISTNGTFAKNKTHTVYMLDPEGNKLPVPAPGTPTRTVYDQNGYAVEVPDFGRGGVQKTGQRGRREYYREKRRMNDWDRKEFLTAARKEWADVCNRYLPREHWIDHRSYKEQGIDKEPGIHEGMTARACDRKIRANMEVGEKVPDRQMSQNRQDIHAHHRNNHHERRYPGHPPVRFSWISHYTVEGRRRTEIEMLLISILAAISLLIDLAKRTEQAQIKELELMQRHTQRDLRYVRGYGVTRSIESRIGQYAQYTEQQLRQMIREKERRLGELKKEIAAQKQTGHSITPEQRSERGELFGELRELRTAASTKEEAAPTPEKEDLSEDEEAVRYWPELEADGERFRKERQRMEERHRRSRQRALEITANDGRDLQIDAIPSLKKMIDRMRAEHLNFGMTEDYRAITLITMLRAAENEREYPLAQTLRLAIGKYHRGEIDIKEAQRIAIMGYIREISEREWSERVQAQAVAEQPPARRRRRDDMER